MRGYKSFDGTPHPGDLKHRIEIGYTVSTVNENGYPSEQDVVLCRVWASAIDAGNQHYRSADVMNMEAVINFTIRYRADVKPGMWVRYDKEYAVIQLIEDSGERQLALDELNVRYNEQRRNAALEYAETLAGVVTPVWTQEDIQTARTQVGDLFTLLRKYSISSENDKPAVLTELQDLSSQMDEGSLTEYLSLAPVAGAFFLFRGLYQSWGAEPNRIVNIRKEAHLKMMSFCFFIHFTAKRKMDDDGSVTIFAVNRDMTEDVELSCDLRDFGKLRIIEHSVLHHDDVKAVNTEEDPDNVSPKNMTGDTLDGGRLTLRLPALSWNVIRLEKIG